MTIVAVDTVEPAFGVAVADADVAVSIAASLSVAAVFMAVSVPSVRSSTSLFFLT